MSQILNLNSLAHRSRERVRDLGEVFTPEAYVEDMLSLLAKDSSTLWADENVVFFEPSCGHGNIVLPIYKKRLEAFYKKALRADIKNPALYAVAHSLNNLWAIDIDTKNIKECKYRVLFQTISFLSEKQSGAGLFRLINSNKDFFAHVLCSLNWQICENEALSSLSSDSHAKTKASQTKIGKKWFDKNGHKELDFDLSWVTYFKEVSKVKTTPIEFIRAEKYVSKLLNGSTRGFEDFSFADFIAEELFSIGRGRQAEV